MTDFNITVPFMTIKAWIVVCVLALIILSAVPIAYIRWAYPPVPVCVAGPNDICPPEEWMRSYWEFQKLAASVGAKQERLKAMGAFLDKHYIAADRVKVKGMGQDLSDQMGGAAGYTWNGRKFTRQSTTVQVPGKK